MKWGKRSDVSGKFVIGFSVVLVLNARAPFDGDGDERRKVILLLMVMLKNFLSRLNHFLSADIDVYHVFQSAHVLIF